MKKAILFSSIFAIGAAVAVDSDNAIGVTTVGLTGKGAQKLVAVPFAGYGDGDVKVSDLVSPSGLKAGSKLYVATAKGYAVWSLSTDGGDWAPVNIVSIQNRSTVEEASFEADSVTVKRGDAFWLEPADADESATIAYLLGQKPEKPGEGTVSATGGKWNLVSNPLLTVGTFTGAVAGDVIYIQGADGAQVRCQMVKEMVNEKEVWNWKYRAANGEVVTATFAPGDGFWFYPKADRTLTWSAK